MYNSLVERCFKDCVETFRRKDLDSGEEKCVQRCAEKFMKFSGRMGMRFATDLELVAIEGSTVRLRDVYTKEDVVREGIDTVVLALGAEAQDGLFHALAPRRAQGLDLRLIGDALAPRRADSAIKEGEAAGRAI